MNEIIKVNNIKKNNKKTSKRKTTDLQIPLKNNGEIDKRYNEPQFCNKDGKRDKRCNLLSKHYNK